MFIISIFSLGCPHPHHDHHHYHYHIVIFFHDNNPTTTSLPFDALGSFTSSMLSSSYIVTVTTIIAFWVDPDIPFLYTPVFFFANVLSPVRAHLWTNIN